VRLNLPSLKSILNILKSLRRGDVKPKVCPKCGSCEIVFSSGFDLWLVPESYTCKKCGYEGQVFLELEKEDKG
jgi:predicted RNA-binding Zn-ribbon protein involved in translation (DUF1610 family)